MKLAKLLSPVCWTKSVSRTIAAGSWVMGIPVSGHEYVQVSEDGELLRLKCEICGDEFDEQI